MTAYYNENDPFAAAWLRNLIAAGHNAINPTLAAEVVVAFMECCP